MTNAALSGQITKLATGITSFDVISKGGLPKNRTTLIAGTAGSGKTVFAMLPDKRALENPQAVAYKLPDGAQRREGEKWQLCELKSEHDIGNALACLDKAYSRAIGRSRKR